jgi:hypothetical protein
MGAVDEPARAERLHPELRWDYGCTLTAALVIFGLPGVAFLAVLALVPHKALQDALDVAFVSIGGWILLLSAWVLVRVALWYRRCSGVYYRRSATPMRVRAIRNDRGGLYLELHSLADVERRDVELRIQAQLPAWDLSDLDGQVVKVRLDPDPKGPVVVETARGILWPAAFGRRVNRLEGRPG